MKNDWREYCDPDYVLMHHGVKGQKWGVRNYQNSDGTLTAAGKARYGSASGKVEKKLVKATNWENRAINAKTGVGRLVGASMASYRRGQADKAAAKATKDYGALQINKNASRNLAATSESNANIAAGLKKRAEGEVGAKKERLMSAAVQHLAKAENMETGAKTYKTIADAPATKKGGVFIKESIKLALSKQYTSAGRATSGKERFLEGVGNAAIDAMLTTARDSAQGGRNEGQRNVGIASRVNAVGTARDAYYRSQNSASQRWDKIMKDKR